MTTRTQKLANKIKGIYASNSKSIDALPTRGSQGGTNAANIDGWTNYHNGTITRAANIAGMPVLNYWSGSSPTPSSALPTCVQADIMAAYHECFK